MIAMPWLSLLIFLPIAGAILALCFPTLSSARSIALCTALLELVVAIIVLALFEPGMENTFQLQEIRPWISGLDINYHLGMDGLSVLFLPCTALLGVMAILASWNNMTHLPGFYFAMLLTLIGVTMGVFLALDTMLFFLFWELTLPPIYFLISLWGTGSQRRMAAMKYTMYMMFGGIPLFFGFILLALQTPATEGTQALMFSLPELLSAPVDTTIQPLIFLLLVTGFAVKVPLFPFHTWLPTVAMESPAQLTALLVGLKLGAFGLLRFALPLAPEAAIEYGWMLGVLGGFTLIYGACIALVQSNLRQMLAYASISHVGLVVVGIAAMNSQGIQGAVFQLLNFTMIASALMLISGFIRERTGTTELVSLGSMAGEMPRLTALFFLFALASIGLPGTSGFVGEILLIISAFELHFSLGVLALITMVVGAAYLLSHMRRTFWGPGDNSEKMPMADLKPEELWLLLPACVIVLTLGFFPNLVLDVIGPAAEQWLALFN
jgi:NADH-quinone oxidoreductase subunit M